MRDRRSEARRRSDEEGEDNTAWKLLWALIGAFAFTVVLYYFGLI